jgi:hypothetical protein
MDAEDKRNLDQTLAVIVVQPDVYAKMIGQMSDADLRAETMGFDGSKLSKGVFIVNMVLGGHAAYRTQLFLYLKSCGQEHLGTVNLWRGIDPAPAE